MIAKLKQFVKKQFQEKSQNNSAELSLAEKQKAAYVPTILPSKNPYIIDKDDIQVSIVNYNLNSASNKLKKLFSTQFNFVEVIDSGSKEKDPGFILFDNIYYSGLFNESVKLTQKNNKKWLFLICSDVELTPENFSKLSTTFQLPQSWESIGVYAPSSTGRSHQFCKNYQTNNLRIVPMVEGFCFMAHMDVLKEIYPVDSTVNLLGWGIDVLKGYFTHQQNRYCVIDDTCEVHHPDDCGYENIQADQQMIQYFQTFGDGLKQYIHKELPWMNY
ncbi:MAG: hypothetical protein RI995_1899 [Bacteroidota bacterium]|jgi:hypothetical protein